MTRNNILCRIGCRAREDKIAHPDKWMSIWESLHFARHLWNARNKVEIWHDHRYSVSLTDYTQTIEDAIQFLYPGIYAR